MTVTRVYFRDKADFVNQVAAAVRNVAREFGLPPTPTDAFVTAHAALSSGWGGVNSGRGVGGYNIFGMKAPKSWTGPTFTTAAFEYNSEGEKYDITATWKAFSSLEGAIREHLKMLASARYAGARAKLAAGDETYFQTLGQEGWYTAPIASTSASWQSILHTIRNRGWIKETALIAGGLGLLIAFGFGAAYYFDLI